MLAKRIGHESLDPRELHMRALLITALQRNHLWPSTAGQD